jgi:hypothetical protein
MRLSKLTLLITFTACSLSTTNAQERLGHLREWVGKYPSYNNRKAPRDFLKLPEVHRPLLRILSPQDYRFITAVCGKQVPIEMIGDYLIVRKCHSNYCLRGTALLIINIKDGAMHAAISSEKDSEPRWFSTNGKYNELPFRIVAGFMIVKDGV